MSGAHHKTTQSNPNHGFLSPTDHQNNNTAVRCSGPNVTAPSLQSLGPMGRATLHSHHISRGLHKVIGFPYTTHAGHAMRRRRRRVVLGENGDVEAVWIGAVPRRHHTG